MTASGRRAQLDRRSARWRSCFANRRCTTPTRETVASQRIGSWPRTTPKCTNGNRPLLRYMHPAAASTSIPRKCACKLGTASCGLLVRSERDKCTNRDTGSFTWSKDLDCIVGTRWTSQTRMEMQPTWPSLAAQLLLCFMLAASLSLVAILTLSSCSRASLGTHDTSRSAFSRISEVQDSNSCTQRQWMSCNNEELRSLPHFWSRPQYLCDPRSGPEQLGAANIGFTNFSGSRSRDRKQQQRTRVRSPQTLAAHA